MGGPCSGKGTNCQKYAQDHAWGHISIGDVLRDEVEL